MRKLSKISLLLIALGTTTASGQFYYSNLIDANDNHSNNSLVDNKATKKQGGQVKVGSSKIYLNLTSIMFQENLNMTIKFTIQALDGSIVDQTFINNNLYGTELVIMEKGSTDFEGPGKIENISFDKGVLDSSSSSLGNAEVSNISLNTGLYEKGKEYDAYIFWHEFESGSDVWYSSTPRTFTTPISNFPTVNMKREASGATQSLISFNVNYDDSLTSIEQYDVDTFFKSLRLTWNTTTGEHYSDVMDDIIDDPYAYENIWLEWDSENTRFSYYVLVQDIDSNEYDAKYGFQYNPDNFGTGQLVTNYEDPLKVSAGNLYENAPVISYTFRNEDELNDLADYKRVYIDFDVNANSLWKSEYEWISTSLDPEQVKLFELNPTNSVEGIEIVDVKESDGTIVDYASIGELPTINEYGEDLPEVEINGLKPGTDYTATAYLNLDNAIFAEERIELPLTFSTPRTVEQPTLTYNGDNDLDGSLMDDWKSDELNFTLTKASGWDFSDELVKAEDLFESGTLTYTDQEEVTTTIDIEKSELKKLHEGDNTFRITNLKSNMLYDFSLDLNYSGVAAGLFNVDKYPTIYGTFKTNERLNPPKLQFIGSDVVDGDNTKMNLRFSIIDEDGVFKDQEEFHSPLELDDTFESLSLRDINEVEGGVLTPANYVVSETIQSNALSLYNDSTKLENVIEISNLKPDTTYEFTAVLKMSDPAFALNDGWVFDDSGVGEITLTTRVSANSKIDPFTINTEVDNESVLQTNGTSTWEADVSFTAPKGGGTETGINAENIDFNSTYTLIEKETGNIVKTDVLNTEDWYEVTIGEVESLKYDLHLSDLNPNTQYEIYTTTTFNDDVIVDIIDTNDIFDTGLNEGFDNEGLTATWGYTESELIETNNLYSDIYVNLSIDDTYLTEQNVDGYKSVSLIDPYGRVVDTSESLPTTTPNRMLNLSGDYTPGTTISNYKVKINNNDDYLDSGDELTLAPLTLGKLAPTSVTIKENDVAATSADFDITFENFNNVSSAYIEFWKLEDGKEVSMDYREMIDNSFFDANIDGPATYTDLNVTPGTLDDESDYRIKVAGYNLDIVDAEELYFEEYKDFRTLESHQAIFSRIKNSDITSSVDSINVNYSWEDNDSDNDKLDHVEFKLYKTHNGEQVGETVIKQINTVEGNWFVGFDKLESGIEYTFTYDVFYKDPKYNWSEEISIWTKDKTNNFDSNIELTKQSENGIHIKYGYNNLFYDENWDNELLADRERASVTKIEVSIEDNNSDEVIDTIDLLPLIKDKQDGVIEYDYINEEYIQPEKSFTVKEVVTYSSYEYDYTTSVKTYDTEIQAQEITIDYDASSFKTNLSFTNNGNGLKINLILNDPQDFVKNNKILRLSLKDNGSAMTFWFNDKINFAPSYELTYDDLEEYAIFKGDNKYIFELELDGLYVPEGHIVELELFYGDERVETSVTQSTKPLVNPDSMKAIDRFELGSYYVYELYIDANDSVDLQEDLSFTYKNSNDIDTTLKVLDESTINAYDVIEEYDENHIYLRTTKNSNEDFRDLSFLVGRYIVVDNSPVKSSISFESQNAYFINDFEMIPMPKEPLTLFQWILIILLTLLLILILWIIIYKLLKYFSKDRWYDYAIKESERYYDYHKQNMLMFGWTHKFNEYESLNDMSIPQLREYAKKMDIPIPYKLKKQEMVDILSLLNETELSRIKDFSEYEFIITDEIRDDLINKFQEDKNVPRWMKKRYKYYTDRQNRMLSDDYKRSFKDWMVDFYALFDKLFITGTEWVLLATGIKEKKVEKVNPEEYDWEKHSIEEELVTEGAFVEVDNFDNESKGGDSND